MLTVCKMVKRAKILFIISTAILTFILVAFFVRGVKNGLFARKDKAEESSTIVEHGEFSYLEEVPEETEEVEEEPEEPEENEDTIPEYDESIFGSVTLYDEFLLGLQAHDEDEYLTKRKDLASIKEEIPDCIGWLTVPNTSIDYEIMMGPEDDPFKYLWKDVHGNESKTGSLFIRHLEDLSEDDHMVIYGHRLKDHSLYFGPLLDYKNKAFAQERRFAYVYFEDKVIRYRLYSVNTGQDVDAVYMYPFNIGTVAYDVLIQEIEGTVLHKMISKNNFNKDKRMLVLSTCSGPAANMPDRLYLIYEEDCYWEYPKKTEE